MARTRGRLLIAGVAAAALIAGITTQTPAAELAMTTRSQKIGPGVTLSTFTITNGDAPVSGELIRVNLANPNVSIDLLHPPTVAQRRKITQMANSAGAVAGVNGDFFNIEESQHPGVAPTNSAAGPEVTDFKGRKGAVPNSQRFGPGLARGTGTRDVIGVGDDGRARIDSLRQRGSVTTENHRWELRGFNQYALPQSSIGAFTSVWGSVSRKRAVCGSDRSRADPCTKHAAEVTVGDGRVVKVSRAPGAGAIGANTIVLVGRGAGAKKLRSLDVGDSVTVRHSLVSKSGTKLRFAVGGAPILRHGSTLPGVDGDVKATRTGAGISANGRRLYLVTLDGSSEGGGGLTLRQLAKLLRSYGARDGMNLDGGGSTTCAAKMPGSNRVTLCNKLAPGVEERAVANGIGVFVK